jgi:dTDP-glucose pyrophosphorylase
MKKAALVILAAGIGSRFGGGIKQLEPVGPNGEIIMDYSIHDAIEAGFSKVVFIIRRDLDEDFRRIIGDRISKVVEVAYAYQAMDDLPEGFSVPEGRKKPWGTGQAVLAARDVISEPFAVINADDYYGPSGFVSVYEYLTEHEDTDQYQYCMAGYILSNTITENGHVARGVCEMDEDGYLKEITERTKIQRQPEGICYTEDDGASWHVLEEDTLVSMNFWGFTESMIAELKAGIDEFFEVEVPKNPMKSEYLLPRTVDKLIKGGKARVKVLPCHDKWCGVTYKEDWQTVHDELQSKKDKGEYPEKLWK